jgi:hypothetical protein
LRIGEKTISPADRPAGFQTKETAQNWKGKKTMLMVFAFNILASFPFYKNKFCMKDHHCIFARNGFSVLPPFL